MEIEKTQLEQIIAQAANPDRLEPDQIPELDLYIDQILMLFEDKLGDNRRHEKDKILTKSMVNNYSKERMIRPMRGKKYTREQILQILLICSLKNMLSIGDITPRHQRAGGQHGRPSGRDDPGRDQQGIELRRGLFGEEKSAG